MSKVPSAERRRAEAGVGPQDFVKVDVGGFSVHDYSTGDVPASDEQTWDTTSLRRDFEVLGFLAPFVDVCRRSDGVRGTVQFNHFPRVYFGWRPEDAA